MSFVTRSLTKSNEGWFQIQNATWRKKSLMLKYHHRHSESNGHRVHNYTFPLQCPCLWFYVTVHQQRTFPFACLNPGSCCRALSTDLLGVCDTYCKFLFTLVIVFVFVNHFTLLWMGICLCEHRLQFTGAALSGGLTGDSRHSFVFVFVLCISIHSCICICEPLYSCVYAITGSQFTRAALSAGMTGDSGRASSFVKTHSPNTGPWMASHRHRMNVLLMKPGH